MKEYKDQMNLSPDMLRVCSVYMDRCNNTIEFMIKEYLSEEFYKMEFDRIINEKDFDGRLLDKLYYLLDKVRSLFFLRDILIQFLQKIDNREVI